MQTVQKKYILHSLENMKLGNTLISFEEIHKSFDSMFSKASILLLSTNKQTQPITNKFLSQLILDLFLVGLEMGKNWRSILP